MEEIDPNTLLSHPGPRWGMRWFDGGLEDLQLDIVGFLAILGEDAVRKTARLASLSSIFYLPRLMPAPHSLLYVERPENIESVRASVTAVHSGNQRDYLNHVTDALFGFQMQPFEVRCLRIRQVDYQGSLRTTGGGAVRANLFGPVNLVNMFGCILSIALFVLSVVYGDGMSLIATVLLSLLSSLIGLTSRWHMQFKKRPVGARDPPGDCVIRWPNGSYLVLKCNESLAHQLLFAPDAIAYKLQHSGHFIPVSLLGTLILMISVIALANAKIQLQIAWAASYVILNIGHWMAAALPRSWSFDFSGYEIEEEHLSSGGKSASFAEGLFKAIVFTRSTSWIKLNTTVPDTEHWREWLRQAELAANGCRTSDDIVEEVPMPRALRRHGMSPIHTFPLSKKRSSEKHSFIRTTIAYDSCYANNYHDTQLVCTPQLTHGLVGTWGKAHACGVTHETPNPDIFQSDKAFNDIANRILTKEMTPVPE